MAQEIGDNSIKAEVMDLENGDDSYNSGTLAEDATDNSIDVGKMESDGGDVEGSDWLAGGATDPVEQGGDLTKYSGVPEETTGKISPLKENDFPEGHARGSTAFIVGANHKFPIRSRYLSASVGSCHDFCKYGHKHQEPEKKIKRPFLGTIRESQPLSRTSSDNLVKFVLHEEPKKKTYCRRLSLPGPSIAEIDPPTKFKKNHSEKDLNQLKSKCIQSEVKSSSIVTPGHSSSRNRSESAGKKRMVQSSNLVENRSHKAKEIKTKTKKEAGSHEKGKEEAKEPMNYSMSPKTPLKKSPSIKARLYKNLRSVSNSKVQSISDEAKVNGSGQVPDKKSVKKASKVVPPNEASPSTPQRSHVRKIKVSKDSQKETQNDQSSSLFPSAPASTPTTEKKFSQTKGESQQNLDSINTKVVGKVKSDDGSKPSTPRTKSTTDSKSNPKRRGSSLSEETDASAWKVKFKRGTVVALQVANSTPKKLQFKRGRNMGDHQNVKDETARGLNRKDYTGNEPNGTKSEPGKVQLRHQEASGKKDNVDLNNVIEETASKLAKTRKSKVKALVGAFETVMSLRDRKPAMEAGAS